MPSNIQTLNELSSVQITNNTIEKIPNYLKKFKEDNSKEIASWINNSKSSSVTEMILAMGSGVSYKSNGTNQLFESYSSFILGKTGYQNRWQLNYVKDSSVRDDDFILTYFDGINHFKRFSVEATTGTIKSRSADFRNGNEINCNADYQIALGYSDTAPFNDYSIYRHNFRSSHTVNPALNVENAVDLYLWDATNDKPEAIGSRHVLRWDASGNEELVSGFRIDGGVNFDISTDANKLLEKDNYAISGKGVIYYNKSTNKYRYSENNSLFKDFGSGSGGISTIESIPYNFTTKYRALFYGEAMGIRLYLDSATTIDGCYLKLTQSGSGNSHHEVSLYVSNDIQAGAGDSIFSYTLKASKQIDTVDRYCNNMVYYQFDSPISVTANKWIVVMVRVYNSSYVTNPSNSYINVGLNMASSLNDSDVYSQPQFMFTGLTTLPTSLNLNEYGTDYPYNDGIDRVSSNVVPYIKIKIGA